MQFNTTPALIAAVDTAEMFRSMNLPVKAMLIFFGINIVTSLFATWFTSLIVAKPNATLGRAAKLMISQLIFCLVFAVLLAVAFAFLGAAQADGAVVAIIMVGAAIVFITVMISIPMQIYEIGAWRSIGLLLLSAVVGAITFNIAAIVATPLLGLDKYFAAIQQQVASAATAANSKRHTVLGSQPAPPSSQLLERQAKLKRRYDELEIRRKYLPVHDHKAFAAYERDRIAYEQDLAELRAEFSH